MEEYTRANPALWNTLKFVLPVSSQIHDVKHREAPTFEELKSILPYLMESKFTGDRALAMGILTVGRATEFRAAKWDEIDLQNAIFTVPPARRKDCNKEAFLVPLSTQTVDMLSSLNQSNELVFPGRKGTKPITTTSILHNIKKWLPNHYRVTVHGIRSTFSDWCADNGKDFNTKEMSLMHAVGNAVTRAYQRTNLLEPRRVLMQEWADALLA